MIKHNAFNADEKILRHLDKIDYFFNSHKTLVVAELDLTNRCNNKCPGCIGNKENEAELSISQLNAIAESLHEIEARGVILSGGGEPLISPSFTYAVNILCKNGIKLGLNSNGLALNEKNAKCIAENCEYFRVSLDAASYSMYKKTHGMPAAAFDTVVENCRKFVDIRNRTSSHTSFGIGFLTRHDTISEMEMFVQLVRDIGADFAQFRPFQDDKADVSDEILRLQDIYNTETFHVTGSIQKYKEMTSGEVENARPYKRCKGMFFSTVITADAKVFACLHFRQSDKHYIGCLDMQTLSEIFRSARMREVYESIDCGSCPVRCRNDAFNRTLDTLALDVNHKEFL